MYIKRYTHTHTHTQKTVHSYTISLMVLLLLHMVFVLFIVRCVCLFALLPSEELNSLMPQRTKDFFSLFVRLFGRSSLSLNWLLWLLITVCRGWLALSMMPSGSLRVLLSTTVTRGYSFMPTTEQISGCETYQSCSRSPLCTE